MLPSASRINAPGSSSIFLSGEFLSAHPIPRLAVLRALSAALGTRQPDRGTCKGSGGTTRARRCPLPPSCGLTCLRRQTLGIGGPRPVGMQIFRSSSGASLFLVTNQQDVYSSSRVATTPNTRANSDGPTVIVRLLRSKSSAFLFSRPDFAKQKGRRESNRVHFQSPYSASPVPSPVQRDNPNISRLQCCCSAEFSASLPRTCTRALRITLRKFLC